MKCDCFECERLRLKPPIDAARGNGAPVRARLRVAGRGEGHVTVELGPFSHGMGQTLAAALQRPVGEPAGVRRIDCTVLEVHVRGRAGWQRLVVDLWADNDAQALAWLRERVARLDNAVPEFIEVHVRDAIYQRPDDPFDSRPDRLLSMPIGVLGLHPTTARALRAAGLLQVTDLVHSTALDLLRLPELGRRRIAEIEHALAMRGHVLGRQRTED